MTGQYPIHVHWSVCLIPSFAECKIESHDMSNLLGRAGFRLMTVDVDEVKVMYPNIWELVSDLRDMGENNAAVARCVTL